MKIVLIRHGKTGGNIKKKYIGKTDEPLCEEGVEELKGKKYPPADMVIVSPMLRCRQTAEIIYGGYDIMEEDLRETDFGRFEGGSFEELKDDPYYIKWLESGGNIPFPGGEGREDFIKRCLRGFENVLISCRRENCRIAAFIVHGGTIMAIAQKYLSGDFYDYHLKNGEYMVLSLYDKK